MRRSFEDDSSLLERAHSTKVFEVESPENHHCVEEPKESNHGTGRSVDTGASRLVESGVIKAWMETKWGDWQSCFLAKPEETYSAMSLFEAQSVFLLFLLTAGMSFFAFLAEIVIGGKYQLSG
ncbi:hypothetical protein MRX96_011829 [Rhipicephalus microplus]